jgi:outer membrane protein TolC
MPSTKTAWPQPNDSHFSEIARRAYEIYESRDCAHGADLDDWLQAERDLQQAETAKAS